MQILLGARGVDQKRYGGTTSKKKGRKSTEDTIFTRNVKKIRIYEGIRVKKNKKHRLGEWKGGGQGGGKRITVTNW